MRKKLWSIILTCSLIISMFGSLNVQAQGVSFSDLPSSHWAYPYVAYMAEKGIISGYPDGSFKPNAPFSRAAFAKLLYLTFELSTPKTIIEYQDLPSTDWAYNYIQGASEYLTYFDTDQGKYFYPNDDTVREDVAVAMVVTAGADETYEPNYNYITKFDDYNQMSPNLRDFLALAVELGIMQGSGANFNPQGSLTRAEACTVFARYVMEIEDTLVLPVNNSGKYVLTETVELYKGAYYNSETGWKKGISIEPGEAIVQIYDDDFSRGITDQIGYDVQGTIRWANVPEVITPDQTYIIDLSLELSKNYNPEGAFIEILAAGFSLYLDANDEAYYGVFILDENNIGSLSAGSIEDDGVTQGGALKLIYEAPPEGIERIAIKIESGEGFEYMYIYEWNE